MPDHTWDEMVDIVVVGFGCAGACAAIEAADRGSRTLVLERFSGGGATKRSGGVIYAGATPYQAAAGFQDSPENMFNYLKLETKGVVTDETLRTFCEESPRNLEWLEQQGLGFSANYYPTKTSYPPQDYYLYFSGNESFPPYHDAATPVPRGHRCTGKDMLPGTDLFRALKRSALRKGVDVRCRSRARTLLTDAQGAVIGVEYSALPSTGPLAPAHRALEYLDFKLRYSQIGFPPLSRVFQSLYDLMERTGQRRRVRARQGVILSAGGFVFNRAMIRQYAPRYLPGKPLGSNGDDGSGIRMGLAAGAACGQMHRVSTWRFITPPEAMVMGIVVDMQGQRFCNEQLYGAQMGEYIVEEHGGKAVLVMDSAMRALSLTQVGPRKIWWFQNLTFFINHFLNSKAAGTIAELADKCGIPADRLNATIAAYNTMAREGRPDPLGKAPALVQPIVKPPFYAIDISLGNRAFPCATLTLGGLVVEEATGRVKRPDGSIIDGLYAAGRTAVGVSSQGYVSGLALAHCVWSGRHAAAHASTRPRNAAG